MLAALTEVLHPERPSRLEFNAPRLGWHFSKTLQEFEDLMVESDDADDVIEKPAPSWISRSSSFRELLPDKPNWWGL